MNLNESYVGIVIVGSTLRDAGLAVIVDPSSLSDRDAYRLMISAFIPRPIAFVSTRSLASVDNCAPFSYSMGVSSQPMVLAVSVGERDGRPKDTARNILDTREFVVNLVTEAIAERMNQASGDYAGSASEFDEAGLTRAASEAVRAPRIAESPVNFECRLIRTVRVADNLVFFGEALRLHVDDAVLTDGLVDIHKLRPIGRLGGPRYCRTQDVFEMVRPKVTGPKSARPTEAR